MAFYREELGLSQELRERDVRANLDRILEEYVVDSFETSLGTVETTLEDGVYKTFASDGTIEVTIRAHRRNPVPPIPVYTVDLDWSTSSRRAARAADGGQV